MAEVPTEGISPYLGDQGSKGDESLTAAPGPDAASVGESLSALKVDTEAEGKSDQKFDPSSVPDYYEGDDYYFGYPHRGVALIINMTFVKGWKDRPASKKDEEMLREIFTELGFTPMVHRNLKHDEMEEKFKEMAKRDHSCNACFVCVVLTHGNEELSADEDARHDVVFGTDGKAMSMEAMLSIFSDDQCPSLIQKPRLFFIQACRGKQLDDGQEVGVYADSEPADSKMEGGDGVEEEEEMKGGDGVDDDEESPDVEVTAGLHIPLSRDFLLAYGAPPGHIAWLRKGKKDPGSWFVKSLHKAVKDMKGNGENLSLMQLLTRTSTIQGHQFVSESTNKDYDCKKAVPHITSMLTKEIFFH